MKAKASLILRRVLPLGVILAGTVCFLILTRELLPKRAVATSEAITLSQISILNQHDGQLWYFAFSPDAKLLFCSNSTWKGDRQSDALVVWELATGRKLATINDPWGMALSPDGKTLAVGHDDISLRFWDTSTWKQEQQIEHVEPSVGRPLRWLDDKTLLLGNQNCVTLWNLRTHNSGLTFPSYSTRFAVSLTARLLVTFADSWGPIEVWELGTGKKLWSFEAHGNKVVGGGPECVTFAPDSNTFATGGSNRSVYLWNVARKEKVAEFPIDRFHITSVAFSPDGKLVAAGDAQTPELSCRVYLWDRSTGQCLGVYKTRTGVRQLAFSPDGKMLAVGSCWDKGLVELWSVEEMLEHKSGDLPAK